MVLYASRVQMAMRAHGLLPLLVLLGTAVCGASGETPCFAEAPAQARMPGPAPQPPRVTDPAAQNAACEGCHADIAREWRGSMHAQADVDPVYRRALAIEPLAFCRGCHAPEASPLTDAPPKLSQMGVSCVTCHVTGGGSEGTVLAGAARAPLEGSAAPVPAPHPVRRDARFATPAACASCHEFNFPDSKLRRTPERMQSTVSEHAASPASAVACASCHMPLADGTAGRHRSHVFAASRDPAMLRAAVSARAERTSPTRLTITLTPAGVGHAFPTGDLFRRLVVSAEAVGDDWTVVSEGSRSLHRRFRMTELTPGYLGRVLVGDDRVGVGPSQIVELDLGEAARGRTLAWRLEYQRVEHPIGTEESGAATVADTTLITSGLLPVSQGAP